MNSEKSTNFQNSNHEKLRTSFFFKQSEQMEASYRCYFNNAAGHNKHVTS